MAVKWQVPHKTLVGGRKVPPKPARSTLMLRSMARAGRKFTKTQRRIRSVLATGRVKRKKQ